MAGLITIAAAPAFAQTLPVTIEHRAATQGLVDAAAGSGITLVFRIINPASTARSLITQIEVPSGWQVLFPTRQLDVPAQLSAVDTVTIAAPKSAAAGDYPVRYEARLTPNGTPATATVTVRIAQRRLLALSWIGSPEYVPAGEPGTFDLLVSNRGNVPEKITLDVRSSLGSRLQPSWTHGSLEAGASQLVRVVRPADRLRHGARENLSATARADGLDGVTETNLGFEVVPAGRAPDSGRSRLPTTLAIRTGSRRSPGFGSFEGSGALDANRTTTINFGFVSRDRSHPLMFERDRNYVNVRAPGATFAAGDQTWALSYLTENGHYGLGAGGQLERRHWSAGAFIDTGRYDVNEGSQAGGSVGVHAGNMARLSVQYLARFAGDFRSDKVADLGSVRLVLKPLHNVTTDLEAGIGQSAAGTGHAFSGLISFNSRRLSIYGRRVRRDDAYPMRDRTGLIDGGGLTVRPFGQFQIEGTLDGTGQLHDPGLSIDAPTRQRTSRARVSWGSVVSLSANRIEWTTPGGNWSAQWRRESVTAELRIPLGAVWLSPGIERGTEATPSYVETPYSLSWLQAGIRIGARYAVDARIEYGRGDAGDANRTVRRVSFGTTLQPIDGTRLTMRLSNGARDALWLQGSQSISGMFDQRLPWRHRVLVHYERRSGGTFVVDDEAYRVDYVIPVGIPLKTAGNSGRIIVRLRDSESGQPRAGMLVQIKGQSRLTDREGVVAFTGLTPGDYHITVAPNSLGPGRTVVPALPLRVSVKSGGKVEVNAAIVRTGTITGALQVLPGQAPGATAATGLANAIIELVVNGEHRVAVTDTQGRFTFDEVPPGAWRLRVVRADVPAFYKLEEALVTVTLGPAETRHIVLRVVPKSQ